MARLFPPPVQGDHVTDQPFGNIQIDMYLNGALTGARPPYTTNLDALEDLARDQVSAGAYGYVAGSAGTGATAQANREAFDRWRIVPRMLVDASVRSQATTVLGTDMPAPVVLAPVGVQTIMHADGELASARAAAELGLVFTQSTAATHSMEEVADASGDGARWYQLYWPKDRDVAASFVARAEAAGYSAIMVTLDTFVMGWRPVDLDTAYLPFLQGQGIQNYTSDPAFNAPLGSSPEQGDQVFRWAGMFGDPTLTWKDLAWLREQTSLPIALKGVLHPDDARQAVDAGVDGIVVSNHGGRQVNGAVASLDALPAVVEAVGDSIEVLFDSGIRTGADVVKALALGADAVLYGRPYLYGLALGGQEGVSQILRYLLGELDVTMALAGLPTLEHLTRDVLVPAP